MEILQNYVNGKFVDSKSSKTRDIMNPALDEVIAKIPISTKEEVLDVIAAAKAAFPKWKKTPSIIRIQPLLKLQAYLKDNLEEITEAVVKNHGKEYDAAKGEVIRAYQMIESALSVPEYLKGEYMDNIATGIDEYSIRIPLGVFVMIPPFNFPAMIPFWFWPFAVASGNTYIIKSNEQTPLAMQVIFKYIDKAGFPPGVINMVHGEIEAANTLIEHPDVKGVSSVGSTPVALDIYRKASHLGKRAQCHGGANNFMIVTESANVDKIIGNMMNSCFGNTGQRCLAGSVVMTIGSKEFAEKFKARFIKETKSLKVGYGMDKDSFMGPVVSKAAKAKLLQQIEDGIKEGAKLILDGRGIVVPGYEKGYFLGPCLFEDVKPGMVFYDEEVFGPVVILDHRDTLDEAIEIINANPKGNAVSIYTEIGEDAKHFRNEILCGNIGINIGVVAPLAWFPFAGAKDSFFGTLRAQGRECVQFFTQQNVVIEKFHGSTKIEWD